MTKFIHQINQPSLNKIHNYYRIIQLLQETYSIHQFCITFGGPLSGDLANNSGAFSVAWLEVPWDVVSDGRAPLYSLNL